MSSAGINTLSARALGVKPRLDLAKVRDRPRNAIYLCYYKHVAFAGEVERSGELRTFGVDRTELLAEHLRHAGRIEVAELRLKTGSLLKRGRSCISNFHCMPLSSQ